MLTGGEVPELDGAVVGAAEDVAVVELEAGDAVGVAPERELARARLDVPDLDGLVVGAGEDAVGVGLEGAHGGGVALAAPPVQRGEAGARGERPEPQVAVERAGDDALRVEVQAGDGAGVAEQRLHALARLQLPDLANKLEII